MEEGLGLSNRPPSSKPRAVKIPIVRWHPVSMRPCWQLQPHGLSSAPRGDDLAIVTVKNESRNIGCLQMRGEVSLTRSLARTDFLGVRCLPWPPQENHRSR
jgi:hypothetical protein